MILDKHPEIQRLTPAEKFTLISELWDELAATPAKIPVSEEHLAELDRRLEEYRKDPSRVTSWESIKQKILGPA